MFFPGRGPGWGVSSPGNAPSAAGSERGSWAGLPRVWGDTGRARPAEAAGALLKGSPGESPDKGRAGAQAGPLRGGGRARTLSEGRGAAGGAAALTGYRRRR